MQTQDSLDRLYLSAGLGTTRCTPEGAGGGVREAWPSLLRLLPPKPKPTERVENRWMEQTI